jgi:hypothetical protein
MDIASVSPAQCPHPVRKGGKSCLSLRIVSNTDYYGNSPHFSGLLRVRSKWPCRRTTDKTNELAPSHCHPKA